MTSDEQEVLTRIRKNLLLRYRAYIIWIISLGFLCLVIQITRWCFPTGHRPFWVLLLLVICEFLVLVPTGILTLYFRNVPRLAQIASTEDMIWFGTLLELYSIRFGFTLGKKQKRLCQDALLRLLSRVATSDEVLLSDQDVKALSEFVRTCRRLPFWWYHYSSLFITVATDALAHIRERERVQLETELTPFRGSDDGSDLTIPEIRSKDLPIVQVVGRIDRGC